MSLYSSGSSCDLNSFHIITLNWWADYAFTITKFVLFSFSSSMSDFADYLHSSDFCEITSSGPSFQLEDFSPLHQSSLRFHLFALPWGSLPLCYCYRQVISNSNKRVHFFGSWFSNLLDSSLGLLLNFIYKTHPLLLKTLNLYDFERTCSPWVIRIML